MCATSTLAPSQAPQQGREGTSLNEEGTGLNSPSPPPCPVSSHFLFSACCLQGLEALVVMRDHGPSGRACALQSTRHISFAGSPAQFPAEPFQGVQLWPLQSPPALKVPFLPPPAPRMAGRSRAGWEPQGRKEPRVGEFGNWAETGLFCLPYKPAWASAAPSGAFKL